MSLGVSEPPIKLLGPRRLHTGRLIGFVIKSP